MKDQSRDYKSYRREFRALRESGCELYYPEGVRIKPADLAETIAGDPGATYMRDTVYDRKGRAKSISFVRIGL